MPGLWPIRNVCRRRNVGPLAWPPRARCHPPRVQPVYDQDAGSAEPTANEHASAIHGEFEQAQSELVGNAVILTDGKAGTVEQVWLDELHGLRISIWGHYGKWPVSTIKFAQS